MKLAKVAAIATAVLVVLLVVVSAGCTSTTTTTATPVSDNVSGDITVLAATSLTKAMNDAIEQFKTVNDKITVKASYGGSNSLVTQIKEGAVDADLFFSADTANMKKITDAGLADNSKVLLNNSIVLVKTKGNTMVNSLADIAKDGVAIASGVDGVPFASYGSGVAKKFEDDGNAGFVDKYNNNILTKFQNVAEARTAVVTGDCDVAFIYKTDVAGFEDKLDVVEIPAKYNTITELPYTILGGSKNKAATQAFVNFLTSDAGKKIFEKYGFVIAA